jgi:hypothetical protein
MVEEVNKIIYNMLISGRGVFLPEVGTLFIERQGARKISDDKLVSPRNVVNFTSQEQAPSLVSEIVRVAGCSEEQAADIYQRWLMRTRQDATITIGGVGVLNHKSFSIESAFAAAINPRGVKTLVVRRKSNTWLYVLSAVCVAIALGIFSFILWGDKLSNKTQTVAVADKVESAEQVQLSESVVESADTTNISNEATVQTAAQEGGGVEEQSVTKTDDNIASNVAHHDYFAYYVVMGVFSTEQNAERAVEQARAKLSNPVCAILPFKGDKFMVTVFGSDSQAECSEYAKANRDVISDLWVYNKR